MRKKYKGRYTNLHSCQRKHILIIHIVEYLILLFTTSLSTTIVCRGSNHQHQGRKNTYQLPQEQESYG